MLTECCLGGHHTISRGGWSRVFVEDKFFISTRFGSAQKILYCITCLCRTGFKINYLFHVESARNYLFKKHSLPPTLANANNIIYAIAYAIHHRLQLLLHNIKPTTDQPIKHRRLPNVGSMLTRSLRRRSSIEPTLGEV